MPRIHRRNRRKRQGRPLLFPIDWPERFGLEPFGLVMIEAMACGTPVIAYRRGSVPEIVQNNVSGFVVKTTDEAVAAVRRVADLDRAKVRAAFERRFAAERMSCDYVALYRQLLAGRAQPVQVAMLNDGKSSKSRRDSEAIDGHIEKKYI